MMTSPDFTKVNELLDGSLILEKGKAIIQDRKRLQTIIHRLAEVSALESGISKGYAQYVTRLAALAAGIYPSSIQELYQACGRGDLPRTFTVPAINLRMLTFDSACAVFSVAKSLNSAAFIFEIARSEMGYTDQRPSEYATSILSAAIAEGYTGPVFLQGDHFQVSAKRFASTPEVELQALKELITEAILAGFYNIDIDTSTLVDISKPSIPDQQVLNYSLSAMFATIIRGLQPDSVQISIGGEIGEVGGHNSNQHELRAYMEGFNQKLSELRPGTLGLSKISIQTGTSHGGVVLPDGSIAQVAVDFKTLYDLSQIARKEYGMGGAVQHGASTLPDDAFGKFVESEAIEVHLATNFQNITYDLLPSALKNEMYKYLDEKFASERKPGMTDEQFYYKTRKNAIGPYKQLTWNIDPETKSDICVSLEKQFRKLFISLGVQDTRQYIEDTIHPVAIVPDLHFYLGNDINIEDVSDLAD